ncbi:MAG: hypothetical protein ACRC62_15155 [Microcoleus sp.]
MVNQSRRVGKASPPKSTESAQELPHSYRAANVNAWFEFHWLDFLSQSWCRGRSTVLP